jgi:hypothetical protein
MSVEPEGWHMEASRPSWDAEAKTFSFFLHKPGQERVLRNPKLVVETFLDRSEATRETFQVVEEPTRKARST